MMSDSDAKVLDGRAAPPMANGEVIFEAPWQGRVFGMAMALCESGRYEWDEFRDNLIAALDGADGKDFQYFDHFLEALAATLAQKGLCERGELQSRSAQLAARPHGHDHDHDHDHSD